VRRTVDQSICLPTSVPRCMRFRDGSRRSRQLLDRVGRKEQGLREVRRSKYGANAAIASCVRCTMTARPPASSRTRRTYRRCSRRSIIRWPMPCPCARDSAATTNSSGAEHALLGECGGAYDRRHSCHLPQPLWLRGQTAHTLACKLLDIASDRNLHCQ
jgi:hypothetical protein